ncbi:hypothetical protein PTSG_01402 [Salpingoeca rosetta]|uniref:VPS9 domain-containing protein n=1 Tax=Salpingoeca rosetta (strain ATCC 50818 / BSB-021) TaxID=946362 RepID=F2U088_SALR5|nr:uncharacterized protein PTSG_01402 [Salpingoeca rosetta]EGD80816.1 hypothetical protein PTSG_01402 [Salpingoeca rosetta]|eukprot:XP_004997377.1 hypothetical protein PTSG_01402 [Salpingoeca rosetta]
MSDTEARSRTASSDSSRRRPRTASSGDDSDTGTSTTSRASRFQWFRRSLSQRSNSSGDLSVTQQQATVKDKIKGFRSSLEAMMDKLMRDSSHGIDFLANLKKPAAQDVADQLKRFITKFEAEGDTMTPKQQIQSVQNFYQVLDERLTTSSLFAHMSDEQLDVIQAGAERHVMHHIYDMVFSREPDYAAQDMALQTRIRELRWIRPHHLDACIDLTNPDVVAELESAQEDLITVDAKRAPHDKLECIVTCAKNVFTILQKSASSQQAASADDFVPALIYTLIQANPPKLYSNIKFIQNFGNPRRHEAGEAGYYFTNLFSAAEFVRRLSASHLKMTQEQFESLMDGDASSVTEGLESIKLMRDSVDRLRRLENKQRVLQRDVDLLLDTLSELCASAVKPIGGAPDAEVTEYTRMLLTRDSSEGKRARRAVSSPASPFARRKWSENTDADARSLGDGGDGGGRAGSVVEESSEEEEEEEEEQGEEGEQEGESEGEGKQEEEEEEVQGRGDDVAVGEAETAEEEEQGEHDSCVDAQATSDNDDEQVDDVERVQAQISGSVSSVNKQRNEEKEEEEQQQEEGEGKGEEPEEEGEAEERQKQAVGRNDGTAAAVGAANAAPEEHRPSKTSGSCEDDNDLTSDRDGDSRPAASDGSSNDDDDEHHDQA